MMKTKTILLMLLLWSFHAVDSAMATDWNAAVRYWYYQNVSTNVPSTRELVKMEGNDNATVSIAWLISPHPTREELISIEPAAVAFWAARRLESDSDFSAQFDRLLKAFALVTLDEINLLRVKAGLAPRTVEQLKTAVKNKYQEIE